MEKKLNHTKLLWFAVKKFFGLSSDHRYHKWSGMNYQYNAQMSILLKDNNHILIILIIWVEQQRYYLWKGHIVPFLLPRNNIDHFLS